MLNRFFLKLGGGKGVWAKEGLVHFLCGDMIVDIRGGVCLHPAKQELDGTLLVDSKLNSTAASRNHELI